MTIYELTEDIPWECTSDGKAARIVRLPQVSRAGAYLRGLAYAKLKDVQAVSAIFKGLSAYFERRILILSDEARSMRVTSLFLASEAEGTVPSICVRTAHWTRDADYQSFEAAPSGRGSRYVASSGQFASRIKFYASDQDRVTRLLGEVEARLRRGVPMSVPVAPLGRMLFDVCFDDFDMEVSFNFDSGGGFYLFARQCESVLAGFELCADVLPDDGCSISYEPSVLERIDSFSGR